MALAWHSILLGGIAPAMGSPSFMATTIPALSHILWRAQSSAAPLHSGFGHTIRIMHPGLQCRLASTSSQEEGPPREKLRAIPFRTTMEQARDAYESHHSKNPLLARPSADALKLKDSFLPFWLVNADVQVNVASAQVGFRRLEATRKGRPPSYTTVWRHVGLGYVWQRAYPSEEPAMQIYASYKYPRSQVRRLSPGEAARGAAGLTSGVLQSGVPGQGTCRVGAFQITPEIARKLALNEIRSKETAVAEELIMRSYGADEVRFIDLRVTPLYLRLHPVYVPAFIFSSKYHDTKLRTFVSGVDPSVVVGTRAYDREKAAVLGGFAGAAVGVVAGLTGSITMPLPEATVAFITLPAIAAWLLALLHPLLSQRVMSAADTMHRAWHGRGAANAADTAGTWDSEWVHAYQAYERYQRFQQDQWQGYRRQQQAASAHTQGPPGDPLGYYKRLGVEPGCSRDELQAAFRGMALQHHPDRYTSDADKAAATERFKKITEAYQVLRDPRKRQLYDSNQHRGL